MKKGKFQLSKERLGKKLSNWVERLMSMGAKEELIKTVARSSDSKPCHECLQITCWVRR
jgi:hypothetical protein